MKQLYFIFLFLMATASSANAQWPQVNSNMRPWTRWWWMGNAVDSTGIYGQLGAFKNAGIGGVEIVPIYGAVGAEEKYIKYLSPEWLKMLDLTVNAASERDMGVYMSVGSGWPIGGPQVTLQDAASKLIIQEYDIDVTNIKAGKRTYTDDRLKIKNGDSLLAVTACSTYGKTIGLSPALVSDGTLEWDAPMGNWKIYLGILSKTKQKVKRAAPGGEGYTLDHFSADAVKDYLQKVDIALHHRSHGVWAFYNDSYEVFNADFSPSFFTEFLKRRGYDLSKYLNLLSSKENTEQIARVKSDYRETMSDMMIENFSAPFNRWSHDKKALSLNQAHGSPANLLDMYAGVDIPETETFGATHFDIKGLYHDSSDYRNVDPELLMMKFASSAAHARGNNLTSSETFTWLSEHFKATWAQCKPEVENLFLAGINHVFFHGTTYSPKDAAWPGWLFYASVEFVPNNSLWPHLNAMNSYITRCQSILQSGKPDNEVLVYWPVYDAWENAKGMDLPFRVHDVNEWLQPTAFYKDVKSLQAKGYSVDFVSDKMLSEALTDKGFIRLSENAATNKILVIPSCKRMPFATMDALMRLAQHGATIVFQSLPESVPGLLMQSNDKLEAIINKIRNGAKEPNGIYTTGSGKIILHEDIAGALKISNVYPETITQYGLQFIRRQMDDGKYYFIVNHTGNDIDTVIPLQAKEPYVQFLDAQSGSAGYVENLNSDQGNIRVRVQLQSGSSLIIRTSSKRDNNAVRWQYINPTRQTTVLTGAWKLHFNEGGPSVPKDTTINTMQCWTNFQQESYQSFSGTATYSQSFDFKKKQHAEYSLILDSLYESAHIWVNDQDAGYIWCNPAQLKIGSFLKSGKNNIRIEVANLMANRIRYMDRHKIEWRKYHEINFVNINYKNFDASDWPVTPSGINAPVKIQEYKIVE